MKGEMVNSNLMLNMAQSYIARGFSIIPIGNNKKPLVEWKAFQSRIVSPEELEKWFKDFPRLNLAIVTGKISNLVVVDIDFRHGSTDELFKDINTVKVRSGGGGLHYYFKSNEIIPNFNGIKPGIDIRGDGGYIIVPPSRHPSGNSYEWIYGFDTAPIAPLPSFVTGWIDFKNSEKQNNTWNNAVLDGVDEGTRNETAASVAGKLLSRFPSEEWESVAWPFFKNWNEKNNPPLTEVELKSVFKSIAKAQARKPRGKIAKRGVSDELVDIVLESEALLYLDQLGDPYITFAEKPTVGFPIKSTMVKRWLCGKYWEYNKKGFSGEAFIQAADTLEAKAIHTNEKRQLYNRTARVRNTIYYDLGDDHNIVTIDGSGWKITSVSPVLFRRYNHQIPQVFPKEGYSLYKVFDYVNLKDEKDRLLYLASLITSFIPDIPRPALVIIGDHGSAKSTGLKIIRKLVDPSSVLLLSPPSDFQELAQIATHNYCLFLDNVSTLSDSYSDFLCRLVTGVGFSKRKLYTDNDDIVSYQMGIVGINGINLVVERADLLDRSIIIPFQRISEEDRKEETELNDHFETEKPYLLGAAFDVLSKTLKNLETIKLARKPRMADFAKYAVASTVALGGSQSDFLNAFDRNLERQNTAAIDSSLTAQVIIQFMRDKAAYKNTSTKLYEELRPIAEGSDYQIGGGGFPKTANQLWKKIKEVRPNLNTLGLVVERAEFNYGTEISITKTSLYAGNNSATTATDKCKVATVAPRMPLLETSVLQENDNDNK